MKRVAKWLGVALGGLLIVVVAVGAWGVHSQAGARWIGGIAVKALGGKLALGTIDGTIADRLTVTNIRYRDPEAGIDARLQRVLVDISLGDLLSALVHFHKIEVSGIDVALSEPTKPPEPEPKKPFSLKPPIDLAIDSLVVDSVRVRRDDALLVEVTRALFDGHWTKRELAVKRLDVRSPQGEIEFSGRVGQRQVYNGEGRGRFRWKAGERMYTGVLETYTQGDDAKAVLKMSAPLIMELEAQVTQQPTWPWRFTLEAPRFDPRSELLPDSSLTSLAASVSGHGSTDQGAISGKLAINDEPLLIEPLRFIRNGDSLAIDTILRIGRAAGALHLSGDVDFARKPAFARVAAEWDEIVVPAQWAGQELHTHGALNLRGSSESYTAQGKLALGPQDRVADIALDVQGTPERVELKQFDISQRAGRLAARGKIDLEPQLAWDMTATAHDFDPGAFAAQWRGKLGFDVASKGRMQEKGPEATAQLTNLRGELRGRPLSGNADVSVTPPLIASGTVALNSGKSELRFRGRRGDELDATLSLKVASLNDWVPNSGGQLNADFVVRGKWPELAIDGEAQRQRPACRERAHRFPERESGRLRSAQPARLAAPRSHQADCRGLRVRERACAGERRAEIASLRAARRRAAARARSESAGRTHRRGLVGIAAAPRHQRQGCCAPRIARAGEHRHRQGRGGVVAGVPGRRPHRAVRGGRAASGRRDSRKLFARERATGARQCLCYV